VADDPDDAREGMTCSCGHLGRRHLGVRGKPLRACLDCRTCDRFSAVADDLDPAAVERVARLVEAYADEHDRVYPGEPVEAWPGERLTSDDLRVVARAALAAARDGEYDGARHATHVGLLVGQAALTAARDGASCGARYCTTDDVLGPHQHRAGRTFLTSAAPTVTAEQVRTLASESGRTEAVVRDWLRVAGIQVEEP